MKTKLLLGLCVAAGTAFAQTPWKTNGDSASALDYLGTNNNMPLIFKTNGQEAMRINANGNLKLTDTLLANTIRVTRILGTNDSTIHFGNHSVIINPATDVISWNPPSACFSGLAIANGASFARGVNSMAFGNNVNVPCGIPNAYVMGNLLTNNIPNSYQLGWGGGPTVFADATGVGINHLTAHTQTLDVNGTARVRNLPVLTNPPELVTSDATGFLHHLAFTGNPNQVLLGNGTFGNLPAPPPLSWELGGNTAATVNATNNILGTLTGLPLKIYAGGTQRQYINPITGLVGIGSAFSAPTSLLHVSDAATNHSAGHLFRSDGINTIDNMWQFFTGASANNINEKFRLVVPANSDQANLQTIQNGAMRFTVDDPNVSRFFPQQDILIDNDNTKLFGFNDGGHWVGIGRVFRPTNGLNSNATYAPQAHLHISGQNYTNSFVFGLGLRPWFNTGTLYTENSDAMYVGLKQQGQPNSVPNANAQYAVINWSDDNYGTGGSDFLSFNFTSYPAVNNKLPASNDGMEVARFDPGHNNGTPAGTFGVGNFFNIGPLVEPIRRVEILDADPVTGTHLVATGIPQLRLTYQYDANATAPTVGINTDFQSTNLGDLFIDPENHGLSNTTYNPNQRFTGFHKLTPNNTVDIKSQLIPTSGNSAYNVQNNAVPASWPGSTGASGLRFTDLTSASTLATPNVTNGINPSKVLTVDINGDVVLVNPSGSSNNGISTNSNGVFQLGAPCTGATANQITQATIGANSQILLNNNAFVYSDLLTGIGRMGIGAIANSCNPANTLELGADAANPTYPPLGGASGLRFTHLTSLNTPIANTVNGVNNTKVLTVDQNGDVVLINPAGGIGNICGNTSNPLTSNYEIPLAGNIINFTTPANTTAEMIIGNPICTTGVARLVVYTDNQKAAATFSNTASSINNTQGIMVTGDNTLGNNTGVRVVTTAGPNFSAIGVDANSTANTSVQNIALNGRCGNATSLSISANLDLLSSNSNVNIGHQSDITGPSISTATNYGDQLLISATGGTANYGVFANVGGATNNYAIYGEALPASGNQIPTGPNYAGYFVGDVIRTGNDNFTSDSILKQNIDTISNALNTIMRLKPKTFTYRQSSFPSMNLPSGQQYGLIAQDVQTVLPALVNNNVHPAVVDSFGNVITPAVNYLSLEYQQLTGIMIRAMQQQQTYISHQDSVINAQVARNNHQDSLINQLLAAVNSCCANPANNARSQQNGLRNNTGGNNNTDSRNAVSTQDVTLSNGDVIVLNQNQPNPFAEQTVITYNIPQSAGVAQLLFYDVNGRQIQNTTITSRGAGQLNVYANDLTNGVYSYTLIVDGKIIDTKKMVKQQ